MQKILKDYFKKRSVEHEKINIYYDFFIRNSKLFR